MRPSPLKMGFYNTYYFVNVVQNILKDPFPYIRTLVELSDDDGWQVFLRPFPKRSALHVVTEYLIETYLWQEDLNHAVVERLLSDGDLCLPVNYALRAYGIEHTTLTEWLRLRGTHPKSASHDDVFDYYHELILEESFEELLTQCTSEVFHVLFLNREVLRDLNEYAAYYIREAEPDSLEAEQRRLFTSRGTLARRHIPQWVRGAVFHRDRGACGICRCDLTGIVTLANQKHFDHIVPLARHGLNDVTNIQLMCDRCNADKGARDSRTSRLYESWYEGA